MEHLTNEQLNFLAKAENQLITNELYRKHNIWGLELRKWCVQEANRYCQFNTGADVETVARSIFLFLTEGDKNEVLDRTGNKSTA